MEFGAKVIREAQFREKMRGYSPEDVDGFLEQVAHGVEVLEEHARQLNDRAVAAEDELRTAKMTPSSGSNSSLSPDVETATELFEIFSLAKRSADEIIRTAQTEAKNLLVEAQLEADAFAESTRREATEARDIELAKIQEAVREHEARRDALRLDLVRLGDVASSARASVKASLTGALEAVDSAFAGLYEPDAETDAASSNDLFSDSLDSDDSGASDSSSNGLFKP